MIHRSFQSWIEKRGYIELKLLNMGSIMSEGTAAHTSSTIKKKNIDIKKVSGHYTNLMLFSPIFASSP